VWRLGRGCGWRKGKSKVFFFEKKKQKTFVILEMTYRQRQQRDKSFLVLFFKKELLQNFSSA
jgi:hypothetical protein